MAGCPAAFASAATPAASVRPACCFWRARPRFEIVRRGVISKTFSVLRAFAFSFFLLLFPEGLLFKSVTNKQSVLFSVGTRLQT